MMLIKNLIYLVVFLSLFVYADSNPVEPYYGISENILAEYFPVRPSYETISNCGKEDYILDIKYIHITPDPPLKGKEVDIDAAGYLKETVDKGSYIDIVVKYGLVKLLHKRLDLCEEIQKVGKQCPLEQGDQVLQHTVELPKEIPPGKYIVDANVYTPDDRPIACLKATVVFKP
ncbi:10368_t:CDS:2 [Diversispora eburnea]|uniref:Phosphatidylglycerol/phosphatidylinositol transfer protein n=1 Tax=Diversispora eburnea TaxID=1213867 RepID=A0A9N8W4N7_9GLOM|nr:10368_t:CDS:2 [Diversispora eburnea]